MPHTLRAPRLLALLALPALVVACAGGGGGAHVPDVNLTVPFDPANFSGLAIDNPFLPLVPNTKLVFEGTTEEGFEHVETTVTVVTKTILGVVCVEVHDVVYLDGALVEDTLDWYAQDAAGNVWYFGEDSKTISGGMVVSTEGSWEAGVGGALPGIVMLASPVVGNVYAQEDAPGVAEDRASVVSLADPVTVPYGSFGACLHNEEFTPLDPEAVEDKFYAPGLGLVLEVDENGKRIELISVN